MAKSMETIDIFQRRKESLEKVKSTWKNIIEKYGRLKPNQQGDIVDITTGRIIKDLGHLRSLSSQDTLWREPVESSNKNSLYKNNSCANSPSFGQQSHQLTINMHSPIRSSRSLHLTRSKIVAGDNLTVSQPSESESDDLKMEGYYYIAGMNSSSKDPLNILKKHADLSTPSKVRRLRKAILNSKIRKPSDRTKLHQLVRKGKLSNYKRQPLFSKTSVTSSPSHSKPNLCLRSATKNAVIVIS